ncbi:hypothetical protein FKM82_005402 [Ascaphus truei]
MRMHKAGCKLLAETRTVTMHGAAPPGQGQLWALLLAMLLCCGGALELEDTWETGSGQITGKSYSRSHWGLCIKADLEHNCCNKSCVYW